jgi:hypothetical protein
MKPIFHCIALGSWVIEVLNDKRLSGGLVSTAKTHKKAFGKGLQPPALGSPHVTTSPKRQNDRRL